MNKTLAIIQSNYIPWKGYFDIVNSADEFIIYDSVQYTKNDWRNRNKIKTQQGLSWLTIPVNHSLSLKIDEVEASHNIWRKKHWASLKQAYSKAPYFHDFKELFENLYLDSNETLLSKINIEFIKAICTTLNITTKISLASDYPVKSSEKSNRLVDLCKQTNSSIYISGPAAKDYLNEELFLKQGIDLKWMDYSDYPPYQQLHGAFVHEVSVLDLLFNQGNSAQAFMKSF